MAVNQNFMTIVYRWLNNNLFPDAPCSLCGLPAPPHQPLCRYCLTVPVRLEPPLCRCGLPAGAPPEDPAHPELCGRCIARPPEFTGSWPAFRYGPPLDGLINAYKHQGRLDHERLLLWLWQQALAANPPPRPQALVPIPCHWRRHWRRGFSQAERLARGLGDALALPVRPALVRRRATPAQQGRSRAARERNLARAFHCTASVEGAHLAVVDDVMTTASTGRAAGRALLDAGAARVDIWVLARVP